MATDFRTFAVTIPAGTLVTAPLVTNLTMPPRIVRGVDIRIPPGPSGLMGFALGAAGQPVIPSNAGAWIITDNETINWAIDGFIDSGAWQLFGYNAGLLPHTVYLRFLLDLVNVAAQPPVSPLIPVAQLAPVPDAATVLAVSGVTL